MKEKVLVNDVGPRDGLQNQPNALSVDDRVAIIDSLVAAGIKNVELGAFVSPKAVPQMAGSNEVAERLTRSAAAKACNFSALIPNLKGFELAVASGIETVAMVVYASEGMAKKNVNMTLDQVDQATAAIIEKAKENGIRVIATVAVAFRCPFDGPTDPAIVRSLVARTLEAGASQVVIADTIGAANPAEVARLMTDLIAAHGPEAISCHFHDTRALGLANVYAALESGVRSFDASIAGLGGCPFAPGASGNVATEDVVMLCESMGFDSGIDLQKLLGASDLAEKLTDTAPGGRAKPWLQPYLESGRAL